MVLGIPVAVEVTLAMEVVVMLVLEIVVKFWSGL